MELTTRLSQSNCNKNATCPLIFMQLTGQNIATTSFLLARQMRLTGQTQSGRLYRGRWNALRSRWSMCDAEIDWHERAVRQNCSRSGFVNDGIFVLLFSENFNFWVTFIHCTNKEPSSLGYGSLFGMWTYIMKKILWRMVCCLDDLNGGNISK